MYIQSKIGYLNSASYTGAGTCYPVVMPSGKIYSFFIDHDNTDPSYSYSVNNGKTWSAPVVFKACNCTNIAVWYDRWSGIDADLVHVVYTDAITDDTYYRNINLTNNSLSAETTVFAGSTTAIGGALSITRARGGNLICATCIDAGVEYDTCKSTDIGATWSGTMADVWEAGTTDQIILLPGWNSDNQDVMAIFWDASADEISVKRYDNSGDTWVETSISTGMVDRQAVEHFPHFSCAVDLINSQNVLIAWNAVDTANADLKCWTINDTTITAKTDVVLNSADDQGFAALSINGSVWTAFYAGKSTGIDYFNGALTLFYKESLDGGSTWSAETSLILNDTLISVYMLFAPLINYNFLFVVFLGYQNCFTCITPDISPRANYILGI